MKKNKICEECKNKVNFNNFKCIENLGKGGNGIVCLIKEVKTNNKYAMKQLIYNEKDKKILERKNRFINEIKIVKKNEKIPGIIPILDYNKKNFWYTMPIAEPILEYIKNKEICDIVDIAIQLLETLELLHEKNISHRDIKPTNIYWYNNRACLSDFGLVSFPENKNNLTRSNKGLGPIFTIAPEMKRNPKNSDGKKADVFSFAKTLWMLLTNDDKGFDGTYNDSDESHGLSYMEKFKNKNIYLVELEIILKNATNNNPDMRPEIKEFKQALICWKNNYKDWTNSQANAWNFINNKIFKLTIPKSTSWQNINEIVTILNIIGDSSAYNHMIFSDTGGLDFKCAELAPEEGCIYLYDTLSQCFILKPKYLNYETFDNSRWNYFLLEIEELEPILKQPELVSFEYLVEDIPGNYVSSEYVMYGVYDYDSGKKLPDGFKFVRRYVKGKLLIVLKNGPYNKISSTYDGRHGHCSAKDFRRYIEELIQKYDCLYNEIKKVENNERIEEIILSLDIFNNNPFEKIKEAKKKTNTIKFDMSKYIKENFQKFNFQNVLNKSNKKNGKARYCFEFKKNGNTFVLNNIDDIEEILDNKGYYICKDGSIKLINLFQDNDCYFIYDRREAIRLLKNFKKVIQKSIPKAYEEYELGDYIDIKLLKNINPNHLFTKEEIRKEMENADDRIDNRLVINEEGYAMVVKDDENSKLYPVSLEFWSSKNLYVGKYSKLETLDENYLKCLEGFLYYLKTNKATYVDYASIANEDEVLGEIKNILGIE